MKKSIKYIAWIWMIMGFTLIHAQTKIIQGHIYDVDDQEPLTGVYIKTLDLQSHAVSDEDGFFQIKVKDTSGTLVLSLIGYKNLDVKYKGNEELNIKLQQDAILLSEVKVRAYGGNKTNRETAGAITVLDGDNIRTGSGISMAGALNSIPGVRMDQSTLSDARISIRGSGVRSQYGIRDLKVYINGIPLTEADGTTRIEGLDINDLGRVEIIRGPASSIYGGGLSGVALFEMNRAPYQERSLQASTLFGSFGLKRVSTAYRYGGDKINTYISYGKQWYDGYREHSKDERNFLTANMQFYPSDKQRLTVLINRTAQDSEIPGALTYDQMQQNPKQANASNLDKKAGRDQKWTRIGIGHTYQFNSMFSNTTSLFTYFYHLDHPLPYAYLHNNYQSYGARTKFDFNPKLSKFNTLVSFGAEFNQAYSTGTQYENVHGEEGAIRTSTEYKNTLYSAFLQSQTSFTPKLQLALGLSFNGLSYDFKNFLNIAKNGVKKFNGQVSPRAALSYNFGDFLSLHTSVSTGFSPPTTGEIQDEDRNINKNIQAQKAINYEFNAKGLLLNSRFNYDLALYKMKMKDELIPITIQQNITIYRNSGKTDHSGVELALAYEAVRDNDMKKVSSLRATFSGSYSHFRFTDYKILTADDIIKDDFTGNRLTGIAPWTFNLGLDMEMRMGLYANANFYYNDKLPLDDANTNYNKAWSVLNIKLGYQNELWSKLVLDIYAGIDNLTNTKYSSFVALNAVGFGGNAPAYYNPNPTRNYYGGLSLKYLFKK
ncbi:MAG: TonB-dependent receptor [Chitinophagales bacterium]|nr:TonB-dependent receptor [Chitinophagales bacterium]